MRRHLFNFLCIIMLIAGILSIVIAGIAWFSAIYDPTFIDEVIPGALPNTIKIVATISFLIPGVLTVICSILGLLKYSSDLLVIFGSIFLVNIGMVSFNGYNGILPLYNWVIIVPILFLVSVVTLPSEEIKFKKISKEILDNKKTNKDK